MKDLPASEDALVVRTDFSDEGTWVRICREIETPVGEFRAYVTLVNDPAFAVTSARELTALGRRGPYRSFLFAVDSFSVTDQKHPILVLDLADEPGRTFRV